MHFYVIELREIDQNALDDSASAIRDMMLKFLLPVSEK